MHAGVVICEVRCRAGIAAADGQIVAAREHGGCLGVFLLFEKSVSVGPQFRKFRESGALTGYVCFPLIIACLEETKDEGNKKSGTEHANGEL
ncbi:MAG: hypothetical protein ACK5AZ_01400 [Bryobacteraceae bacterium]